MRRSREVAASIDDSLSGFDAYNLMGDAATALDAFAVEASTSNSPSPTIANRYNRVLLSHLTATTRLKDSAAEGSIAMLADMQRLEDEYNRRSDESGVLSPRKHQRNELIFVFNRALVLFAQGDCTGAANACMEPLHSMLLVKTKAPDDELAKVWARLGFLVLECMLTLSVGRVESWTPSTLAIFKGFTMTNVVEWLEQFDAERGPQFKFLLNLYRSRVDLAVLDSNGKHDEARIRSARKELKQAMDIFQHKLRPSFGAETASVVSSANSEDLSSQAVPTQDQQSQQTPSSVVLQRHNQSALSLKANSEQLKGNTKKSLILCSEALTAVASTSVDSTYETLHENNLAVVYETIGKRHLALHALAKGLRATETKGWTPFYADGTARPDQTLLVLHNTAICALQARNYHSAYECMATCIARSPVFSNRPRSWLRLAEACVGIYSQLTNTNKKFTAIEMNRYVCSATMVLAQHQFISFSHFVCFVREPKGVIIDNAALFKDHPEPKDEELIPTLASLEDIEQVKRNPLVRARAALEHVVHNEGSLDSEALASARLTLAYVHLAFSDYASALKMAEQVLNAPDPSPSADEVTLRSHNRRVATARLYAAESSCTLGDTSRAMTFLVGDGQDDAFDRLASDLGGVTIETAATNGKGKRRLARAQAVVRSSASVITAAMGNLTAAKQLAMSAQAMEDAFACNRERSAARRALAYTLLRGGHHGAALSLLRSLR